MFTFKIEFLTLFWRTSRCLFQKFQFSIWKSEFGIFWQFLAKIEFPKQTIWREREQQQKHADLVRNSVIFKFWLWKCVYPVFWQIFPVIFKVGRQPICLPIFNVQLYWKKSGNYCYYYLKQFDDFFNDFCRFNQPKRTQKSTGSSPRMLLMITDRIRFHQPKCTQKSPGGSNRITLSGRNHSSFVIRHSSFVIRHSSFVSKT